MNRIPIRLDDFPNGNRNIYSRKMHKSWKFLAGLALRHFEDKSIPYLLGVSPGLIRSDDIGWLNDTVQYGSVVMHGYDHFWDIDLNWEEIEKTWAQGGEFSNKKYSEILRLYEKGFQILSQVESFDPEWYVPPFNVYNQKFLNVIKTTPVKFLTSVDSFHKKYEYDKLDHEGLELVSGIDGFSYGSIDTVLNNIFDIKKETQITLHWAFDSFVDEWLEKYQRLTQILELENI